MSDFSDVAFICCHGGLVILVQAIEIITIARIARPLLRRLDACALAVFVESNNQLPWLIALYHCIDVGAPLVLGEARQ